MREEVGVCTYIRYNIGLFLLFLIDKDDFRLTFKGSAAELFDSGYRMICLCFDLGRGEKPSPCPVFLIVGVHDPESDSLFKIGQTTSGAIYFTNVEMYNTETGHTYRKANG